MVNTPIPHSLKSEAKKAAKILKDFSIPSATSGPDSIIPAGILVKAEGLAILTVIKVGFLVTARGGSGIVVARLSDKRWSAPSAIGIAGIGGGFEIGAEVTDFVIILNSRSAVEAFSKGGNLTLGGNFTIAAGPLGRNVEGDVAVRSPAAIYTYSKTKGLFAGISIEGSYLVERKDANKKFYCQDLRANEILSGFVQPPEGCEELYTILDQHAEIFEKLLMAKAKRMAVKGAKTAAENPGFMTRVRSFRVRRSSHSKVSENKSSMVKSGSSSDIREDPYSSSYKGSWAEDDDAEEVESCGSSSRSTKSRISKSYSMQTITKKNSSVCDVDQWSKRPTCRSLWSYQAQMSCDLSFEAGSVIEICTRTESQNDWWEGKLNGRVGIFPANYVQIL